MGRLNLRYLASYAKGSVFIETGCLSGWTLDLAKKFKFEKIYGIELHPYWISFCQDKYKNDQQVTILAGESPEQLDVLCTTLVEPATFWLDAHASGPDLPGGKYGGSPLLFELNSIAKSSYKEHTIFIDDVRLLGTNEWDFLSKDQVIDAIYKINKNYKISYLNGIEDEDTFPNDIMLVTI